MEHWQDAYRVLANALAAQGLDRGDERAPLQVGSQNRVDGGVGVEPRHLLLDVVGLLADQVDVQHRLPPQAPLRETQAPLILARTRGAARGAT